MHILFWYNSYHSKTNSAKLIRLQSSSCTNVHGTILLPMIIDSIVTWLHLHSTTGYFQVVPMMIAVECGYMCHYTMKYALFVTFLLPIVILYSTNYIIVFIFLPVYDPRTRRHTSTLCEKWRFRIALPVST